MVFICPLLTRGSMANFFFFWRRLIIWQLFNRKLEYSTIKWIHLATSRMITVQSSEGLKYPAHRLTVWKKRWRLSRTWLCKLEIPLPQRITHSTLRRCTRLWRIITLICFILYQTRSLKVNTRSHVISVSRGRDWHVLRQQWPRILRKLGSGLPFLLYSRWY